MPKNQSNTFVLPPLLLRYGALVLLLLSMLVVWNVAYRYYINVSGWEHDIFRSALQNKGGRICYAPLYVRLESQWIWVGVLACLMLLLFWLNVAWQRQRFELSWHFHALFWVIWASLLACTEQPMHWDNIAFNNFEVFLEGLIYPNTCTLLQYYTTAMQHSLGEGCAHYPPGNLVLVYLFHE